MEGYEIEDPRPIAASAPYTFFLPTAAEIEALRPGDLVKLMFRSIPPSEKWNAEKMWVVIGSVDGSGTMEGMLESSPSDMPLLRKGATIRFRTFHILSVLFDSSRPIEEIERLRQITQSQREYWDRCLVDDCVLHQGVPVQFLYREASEMGTPVDEFPDSGWRLRGDYRGLSDDEIEARKMSYVALGAVLNRDDSWIHLIEEPVGSAFLRNFETHQYERDPPRPER